MHNVLIRYYRCSQFKWNICTVLLIFITLKLHLLNKHVTEAHNMRFYKHMCYILNVYLNLNFRYLKKMLRFILKYCHSGLNNCIFCSYETENNINFVQCYLYISWAQIKCIRFRTFWWIFVFLHCRHLRNPRASSM